MSTTATATIERKSASEIARGIRELEPLPATALQLLRLLNGENVSMARVAELVEVDQAIAASVLRMASSAAFSGSRAPTTVREALMRTGTLPLLTMVMGGYLSRLIQAAPLYDLSESDLWNHGAASQLAVQAIGRELPERPLAPLAATAALLHDVGKLITARYLKGSVADISSHAARTGRTFVDAERNLFGTDHAEVGAAVAAEWAFPPELVHAIAHHHDSPITEPTSILDAVVTANVVAKAIGAGLGAEGFNLAFDESAATRLGITWTTFGRVCLLTDEWLRDLRLSLQH